MNQTIPSVQYIYHNQPPRLNFPFPLKSLESVVFCSVLSVRREAGENRCHDATRLLGDKMMTSSLVSKRFSGARYFVMGSDGPFRESYGNFHHLGLLVVPLKEKRKWTTHSLAIDPDHNALYSGDTRSGAVFSPSSLESVFPLLSRYYGGRWTAQYLFEKEGRYRWLEEEQSQIADYFLKYEDDLL